MPASSDIPSPPCSPGRSPGNRGADSPRTSPRLSHRKVPSIRMTPNWDHKMEDDTTDMMQVAFFPLLQPADPTRDEECTEKEPINFFSSSGHDDDSVTDSVHSHHTANSIWEDVPMGRSDAILGIAQAFRACTDPRKVNVCVGAYRDEKGKPWVLPSVREAERILLDSDDNKEYLPIEGDKEYIDLALKFAYGPEIPSSHLAGIQTLSGTGACRIGAAFLNEFWPGHPIYVPNPTWGNHIQICEAAGLTVRKYRYFDKANNGLDLQGMLDDITAAPDGSIILLHACAHNPTGCDPTIDDWKQIIDVVSEKEHVAFFDSAYQGFASGDAEEDAQPFRYAVRQHVPILLAQSFAKNFGLYGERVGTLSVVCGDEDQKERILSELKLIVRAMYSSPPRHGSSIVKTILKDDNLKTEFYAEMKIMANRIKEMRTKLVLKLQEAKSTHDWSHITRQIGMFAFTGLTEAMCKRLTDEFSIYLTTNGRISMAGLNDGNIEYVANAIHAVSDGQSIKEEKNNSTKGASTLFQTLKAM